MSTARRTVALFVSTSIFIGTGCQNAGGFREADLEVGRAQVIAEFKDQITGVAVSSGGRVFVSSPRWHTDGSMTSVVELLADQKRRVYPNAAWNSWTPSLPGAGELVSERFVCVQAVYVDAMDRLWILDPASPRLAGVVPGGAKLVEVDLRTDAVVRTIRFDSVAAPADSYLNDVRVDCRTQTAYISDSGRGGIVVVDLNSGDARRVLDRHESMLPDPGFVPRIEGKDLLFAGGLNAGQVLRVASDGIALDARGDYLYWQPLTSKFFYRCPTARLRGTDGRPERTALAVENLGETVMTDGMEMDGAGVLYFTGVEQNAIIARTPRGTLRTLVQGPQIAWPDSISIARGKLFFTTSQIHRTAWFTPDGSMPQTPYLVLRTDLASPRD